MLSSFGVVGNLLSMSVLLLKETNNCFNQLLIALNIFDRWLYICLLVDGRGVGRQWGLGAGWLIFYFFRTMRYSGGNIPLNLSEGETPLRPSLNSYNSHKFLHSPLKLIQLK